MVDIEILVQSMQLRFAGKHPEILVVGTVEGLATLRACNLIDEGDAATLQDAYTYLRGVEARLRLMNTKARHDLPEGHELEKLAHLMGDGDGAQLIARTDTIMNSVRSVFDRLMTS